MKKAKILSAFLSLTLVTSFAAVPTTVSAAETTTTVPAIMQTTTAPTYTRTTTSYAPITTTTTVPHSSQIETTSVTVDSEKSGLCLTYYIIDHDTQEYITDNAEVRLEARKCTEQVLSNDYEEYTSMVPTGEPIVLETWNTSESNPHTTEFYEFEGNWYVYAVIDDIPFGYSYWGREKAEYGIQGIFDQPDHHNMIMELKKEKYMDAEFPITGTYSKTISFVDTMTGEPIKGLECVLVNDRTNEELLTWNTTDNPVITYDKFEYRFDDWHMDDAFLYSITVKNMPENHKFHYGAYYNKTYLSYGVNHYENGITEFNEVIQIDDRSEGAPQITYLTTVTNPKTPTKYTTTTASPTEETTATTTEYDANAFFADIEFYHTGNGPKIPDSFDVKLVRRKVTYSANGEKTYLDEDEVLETWDNSEIHPHRTKTYTSDADYEYAVKVDKLPKLITYNYQDNLRVVLPKADRFYSIYLQKWETEIPKLPISKEVETSLIIYDYSVGLNVPRDGLDVTVYILNEDMSRKKEAGHFITGTDDAKFVVPCYFEDIDDSVPLEIVINNMPDGYIYSSSAFEDRNVAYLSCENLLDAIGTDDLNTFSIKGAIFNTEDTVTTSTVLTGTRTTYTTTTIVTTTTETESVNGDANCDGELSMADAVIIMQSLANPDKYGENGTAETHITNQGKINGDIAGNNDGITNADALAIQKKLLKLE